MILKTIIYMLLRFLNKDPYYFPFKSIILHAVFVPFA